jgi:GNAT superfamily N-acetyltransferase
MEINDIEIINPSLYPVEESKLEELVVLINQVYLDSEGELWPHDGSYYRTKLSEIKSYIAKGQLRFAVINSKIVGMVKVFKKDEDLGCFGMLLVHPEYRRYKLGSLLVEHAEKWCRQTGLKNIELELLVANDFTMKEKVMLRKWYSKIEYQLIEIVPFESLYPSHSRLIQVPCSFEIMRKNLN